MASQNDVHATAIVEPGAKLGDGVKVGPFSIVGADVELGDGAELISHAVVAGRTKVGAGTRIYPFASVGHQPQDLKYAGEESRLTIGENCIIRENVTINPGTRAGNMETRIGNHCLLMASSHVAHDCTLGDNVVVANYGGIAGHVSIGDHVTIGGIVVIHQFVRIGAHAFIGAQSMIEADVIPYGMAVGNRARLAGLNLVGLKRRGFDREAIHGLRAAYRMIFSSEGNLRERLDDAAELFKGEKLVEDVVGFLRASSDRAICTPRNGSREE